ncbi:MAG: CpaF family protein [Actinomycetota bacterium]|nr:CpaF family protein [Actinomycetota bacterium]
MDQGDIYPLIRERVRDRLSGSDKVLDPRADAARKRRDLLRLAREVIWEEGFVLGSAEMQEILQKLLDDILGLGPLESLMRDEEITEIMVNGPHRIYVERNGVLLPSQVVLQGDEEVYRIIDRIIGPLGLHVDEASPYVDARLPDGSRVNVILPPLSLLGPVITIRKFRSLPFTLQELVEGGTIGEWEAAFLAAAVRDRKNVVISGGAGSGKTTLLNTLSAHIHPGERIITLEDAAELRLQQPHVVPLETRPPNLEGKGEVTLRDLLRNALRMRPDRIIIGEVRGPEALDLLQALNTGHRGSMTTIHANSPLDALSRLETMALTAGVGLPAEAVRWQIERAVDVVVHMERNSEGLRRVREIAVMEREDGGGGRLRSLEPEGPAGLETPARLRYLADPCASNPVQRKREGVKAAATGPRTS